MRRRNVHIQFWLSEDEAKAFDQRVRKTGLSREAYLRTLIQGLVPQESPPPDYYAMMRELRAIGVNLNQITMKMHSNGELDAAHYDEAVQLFRKMVRGITDAVLLPKPMEGR